MPNPIDKLNKTAHARFEELKKTQSAKSRELPKKRQIEIEGGLANKFDEMQQSNAKQEISEHRTDSEADEFLTKIDSLGLSPNLSLAVSFLVLYHNRERKQDKSLVQKAIQTLETEL